MAAIVHIKRCFICEDNIIILQFKVRPADITVGGSLVSWYSKLLHKLTTSSTHSEHHAAYHATIETIATSYRA
jgi:hypothetical protein